MMPGTDPLAFWQGTQGEDIQTVFLHQRTPSNGDRAAVIRETLNLGKRISRLDQAAGAISLADDNGQIGT